MGEDSIRNIQQLVLTDSAIQQVGRVLDGLDREIIGVAVPTNRRLRTRWVCWGEPNIDFGGRDSPVVACRQLPAYLATRSEIAVIVGHGNIFAGFHRQAAREWQPISSLRLSARLIRRYETAALPTADSPRWSRLRGALPGGLYQLLRRLRVAIVGCGRLGSELAHMLCSLGCCYLLLVDPDEIYPENLDSTSTSNSLGAEKALALANTLHQWRNTDGCGDNFLVSAVCGSAISTSVFDKLADCDLVLCCADSRHVRAGVSVSSSRLGVVSIDVGSSVDHSNRDASLQADARIFFPGRGCYLCSPRFPEAMEEQIVRDLWRPHQALFDGPQMRWSDLRDGSYRPLNQLVSSCVANAIVALLAGRVRQPTWIRARWDHDTLVPRIERVSFARSPDCDFCNPARNTLSE